tara:strand:+ start:1020 stop:1370 length:351 start_codon:yes stop_codon:yes gene_type:complete
MQEQLKRALEFANYKQTFSIQRKTLKEKAEARLTYGFNGGLFHIDQTLLTFVEMLCNKGRTSGVVLLDVNDNPILIEDVEVFKDEVFSRYFEATNEYFEHYQKLKKSRSVEKMLEQ